MNKLETLIPEEYKANIGNIKSGTITADKLIPGKIFIDPARIAETTTLELPRLETSTIAPMRLRGFESVSTTFRKTIEDVQLPLRSTKHSMGYDFYSPIDLVIEPGKIGKIWTDVKAYMQPFECLILNVRSSQGGKVMLANTSGWIDMDYYENESNDGNIGIFLLNISDEPYVIKRGDRIAQGAFFNFSVADNDTTVNQRTGGFGHSGK